MCNSNFTWQVSARTAGQRLDAALAAFLPELSLRARRRLWDTHAVLVNDRPCPAGRMLRENDTICLRPKPAIHTAEAAPTAADSSELSPAAVPFFRQSPPHLIAQHGNLFFFYKPAGLHTSSLEGRGGPSLEAQLPKLCPDHALSPTTGQKALRLVNRLDCGTSGIVTAALSEHDADKWRRMENAGLCEKHYYALLCGHLPHPLTIRNRLDTAKRRVSKILPVESLDTLRHTRFTPLGFLSTEQMQSLHQQLRDAATPPAENQAAAGQAEQPCTLALCTIAKGARHQIRAHALSAGFPLWGDSLYAQPRDLPLASGHIFLLHHGLVSMPGLRMHCPLPWLSLLPENVRCSVATPTE